MRGGEEPSEGAGEPQTCAAFMCQESRAVIHTHIPFFPFIYFTDQENVPPVVMKSAEKHR